jgi:hypothetical protein
MNLASRSRASIFRVALSPARDRAKTYADPVLAPRTIHARVASMHVKRTRAELTLRKSFDDAMHVQRTAASTLFMDDDEVDVDVSPRFAAPSASGDMSPRRRHRLKFVTFNNLDNRFDFRITTGEIVTTTRLLAPRREGATRRAARISAIEYSESKRASVGRRRRRRWERFVTNCFSSRSTS